MRPNRSGIWLAIVGLAAIWLSWGCGSERKPDTSASPKAEQTTEKIDVAPNGMTPLPIASDPIEAQAKSINTSPNSTNDVESDLHVKKTARPKMQAKRVEPVKIISPLPVKNEGENNPVRSRIAEFSLEANPVRIENHSAGEKPLEVPELAAEESSQPESAMLMMRSEEPVAGAAPDEAMSSSPPSAGAASDDPATSPEQPIDAVPKKLTTAAKKTQPEDAFTIVKVFYGTDRASSNVLFTVQPVYVPWLTWTVVVAAATIFLAIVGFRILPSRLIRGTAYCGICGIGVLASLTIYAWIQSRSSDQVSKASSSEKVYYGVDRGKLELGVCEVSIPKSHEVGELESPSVLRLEFSQDSTRHVVLRDVHRESYISFYSKLRKCVGGSAKKSAFVFVHGYNTTFEDAARRTAQIAYDLKFDGAPIFFSWPSQGKLLQYAVDETNVAWTAPHLLKFLTDVAEQSGAEQIHLVAHSMGNRALTAALKDISMMQKSSKAIFNEVVLTAPDIDAEVFINDIAPAIVKTARRVTLYASSNDEALIISKKVHGYPRAGDSGSQLVVIPGVDTVDVSAVDTSLLGHNYYGENSSVLADLFELLHVSKPPDQRQWLHQQRLGLLKYWVFQR